MPEKYDVGEIPKGMFVLWCDGCFTSLMWTHDVTTQYNTLDEWYEASNWAMWQVEHADNCKNKRP